MFFRCPSIQAHYNEAVLCVNLGHLKIMNFPFGTNGKFITFRCPNIKHFRVFKMEPYLQFERITLQKDRNQDL